MKSLVLLTLLICTLTFNAQKRSFCNPLNVSYKFQSDSPSRREAADPTVVKYKDTYFLFASKSGGFWFSTNLNDWKFATSNILPLEDYAPTALVIDDYLYFMALDRKIYKTNDPLNDKWQVVNDSFEIYAGDPCLLFDSNKRLYLFHGLTNSKPIRGIELDKTTFEPLGKEENLISTKPDIYGWERTGNYNTESKRPFLEGAWITENKGIYFLQYASPGTQYKSYSDGLYVAKKPLGPYKLAENNPFSYKPEGFICSAGHSSTFQDGYGNYWHAVTMLVGIKHRFERRLGLFPAFFDKDTAFYTYTGFGDFPHAMPHKKMKGPQDYQPTSMLLSYKKPVEVSSEHVEHPKSNANNEDIQDFWSATSGNRGEWLIIDLLQTCRINAVQINFYDNETEIFGRSDSIYYQYLLEYSTDKINWKILEDKRQNKSDIPHDYISIEKSIPARYVRITNYHVPDGKFAISGLRIFGKGQGKSPSPIHNLQVFRDSADARNVKLQWTKCNNATGYNIRFGSHPDKLYQNYQTFNSNELTIHSLNALQDYYFTIDTFNEVSITKGKTIVVVKTNKK